MRSYTRQRDEAGIESAISWSGVRLPLSFLGAQMKVVAIIVYADEPLGIGASVFRVGPFGDRPFSSDRLPATQDRGAPRLL